MLVYKLNWGDNMYLKKTKILLISSLSFIVLFIGVSALGKAIDAITVKKMVFEVVGFYISVLTLHVLNSLLKDYIREYKK